MVVLTGVRRYNLTAVRARRHFILDRSLAWKLRCHAGLEDSFRQDTQYLAREWFSRARVSDIYTIDADVTGAPPLERTRSDGRHEGDGVDANLTLKKLDADAGASASDLLMH